VNRTIKNLRLSSLVILALLLPAGRVLHAQAKATATGLGSLLSVGGEGSIFQMDYGKRYVEGFAGYADINPTWRYGAEAEVRFSRFGTNESVYETTYLVGPRVVVSPRQGKLRPYAKFLIGLGHINYPFTYATGNYLTYAPGAGVDYVVNDRWIVRAVDFEYQDWPKFTYGALHPYGVSVGIAFRLNPIETTSSKAAHPW
jgi:hypothetical protein